MKKGYLMAGIFIFLVITGITSVFAGEFKSSKIIVNEYIRVGNIPQAGFEYNRGSGDLYLGGDGNQAGNLIIKDHLGSEKIKLNSNTNSYIMGNVGIGTATLTNAKVIIDTGGGTIPSLKLEHQGSNFIVRPLSAGGTSTVIENTGGEAALIINPTIGNVGIGTVGVPSAKLDVAGTAKMTGFQLTTGGGAGKVLTSDASGVGTWQAIVSNPFGTSIDSTEITDGTIKDLDISNTATIAGSKINPNFGSQNMVTTGNVGIGTSGVSSEKLLVNTGGGISPSLKLEHVGSNFIVRPLSAGGTATIIENTGGGALIINPTTGNVGIGTGATTPTVKLDVRGDVKITGNLYVSGVTKLFPVTTGKALCLKADKTIGTCNNRPNSDGTCNCS